MGTGINTKNSDYQYIPGALTTQALFTIMLKLLEIQGGEMFFTQDDLMDTFRKYDVEFMLPAKKDGPGGELVFDGPGEAKVDVTKPVVIRLVEKKAPEDKGTLAKSAGPMLVQ